MKNRVKKIKKYQNNQKILNEFKRENKFIRVKDEYSQTHSNRPNVKIFCNWN